MQSSKEKAFGEIEGRNENRQSTSHGTLGRLKDGR